MLSFEACDTKLAQLLQKNQISGEKQEKTTKIYEFITYFAKACRVHYLTR